MKNARINDSPWWRRSLAPFFLLMDARSTSTSIREACATLVDAKIEWGAEVSPGKVELVKELAPFISNIFRPAIISYRRFVLNGGRAILDDLGEIDLEGDFAKRIIGAFERAISYGDVDFKQALFSAWCMMEAMRATSNGHAQSLLISLAVQLSSERNLFSSLERSERFRALDVTAIDLYRQMDGESKRVFWNFYLKNYEDIHKKGMLSGLDFYVQRDGEQWVRRKVLINFLVYIFLFLALLLAFICSTKNHISLYYVAIFILFYSIFLKAFISWFDNIQASLEQIPARPAIDIQAEGVPQIVLVVVPVLLVEIQQIQQLKAILRHNVLVANDTNVRFLVFTDLPDSRTEPNIADEYLLIRDVSCIIQSVNLELGEKYGFPVAHAHRYRQFNERSGMWEAVDRKVGKMRSVNRSIINGANDFDYFDSLGGWEIYDAKYVMVIDEDTRLGRGSIHYLAGTLMHPANSPVISSGRLKRGVAMAVPGILVSKESLACWRFGELIAGPTYSYFQRAPQISDSRYQYLGVTAYLGKGMYDPNAYELLSNAVGGIGLSLSHDTLEGDALKPVFVSKAVVYDDFPSFFDSLFAREIRWVKGDMLNALIFLSPSLIGQRSRGLDGLGCLEVLRQAVGIFSALSLAPMVVLLSFSSGWFESLMVLVLAFFILEGFIWQSIVTALLQGVGFAASFVWRELPRAVLICLIKTWRSPYSFIAVVCGLTSLLLSFFSCRRKGGGWITNYQANMSSISKRRAGGVVNLLISLVLLGGATYLTFKAPISLLVTGPWFLNPWASYIFRNPHFNDSKGEGHAF